MGTIAPHAQDQPHLQSLLKQLESFELCGEFMLTEVGHGLDARNIETTATLSPDGKSFDLHTPSLAAAKSMPPATPLGGVSKVAVVFAQLVVDSTTHGVRAFVARMTDGDKMCRGISTRLLPQRPGCRPLDHALTYFSHVRLERNCLLGGIGDTAGKRSDFLRLVQRVSVGGLAPSLVNVPALKAAAYLSYDFSRNAHSDRSWLQKGHSDSVVPDPIRTHHLSGSTGCCAGGCWEAHRCDIPKARCCRVHATSSLMHLLEQQQPMPPRDI